MVSQAVSLVSPGQPGIVCAKPCNPASFAHLNAFIVCSIVNPLSIAFIISCDPDSTPNHTSVQPASFILRSSSFVTLSTRLLQSQLIFSFRFIISSHISLALDCMKVNVSSRNVKRLAPNFLLRYSISSTTFFGLLTRYFLPPILGHEQYLHP